MARWSVRSGRSATFAVTDARRGRIANRPTDVAGGCGARFNDWGKRVVPEMDGAVEAAGGEGTAVGCEGQGSAHRGGPGCFGPDRERSRSQNVTWPLKSAAARVVPSALIATETTAPAGPAQSGAFGPGGRIPEPYDGS